MLYYQHQRAADNGAGCAVAAEQAGSAEPGNPCQLPEVFGGTCLQHVAVLPKAALKQF